MSRSLLFSITDRRALSASPLACRQASRHKRTFLLGNKLCRPFTAGPSHKCWLLGPPCHDHKGAEGTWWPARPPDDHNPGNRCKQQEHRAAISSSNALMWLPAICTSEHSRVSSEPASSRTRSLSLQLTQLLARILEGERTRKRCRNAARSLTYEAPSLGLVTLKCPQLPL